MAPALGMGLLLGLLWDPGGATRVLHSLHYLHMAVSEPSPGLPQFMSTGYLDGIPFTRCDSEQGQVVPLTQWIKDGADQGYWNREIEICVLNQHVYARGLDTLRTRYNQSGAIVQKNSPQQPKRDPEPRLKTWTDNLDLPWITVPGTRTYLPWTTLPRTRS